MSQENNALLQSLRNRRSVRNYTDEHIPEKALEEILSAGLLAPSARNMRTFEFVLVQDPAALRKLAESREIGAGMLEEADAAIVVFGDGRQTDLWIEDCSIAMAYMHLVADSLGIGSCWVQGRGRSAGDGRTTEEFVRELLSVPDYMRLEATLALGIPVSHPEPRPMPENTDPKIHREKF